MSEPGQDLLLRSLQSFAAPDPLDAVGAHGPAWLLQQNRDAAICIPAYWVARAMIGRGRAAWSSCCVGWQGSVSCG